MSCVVHRVRGLFWGLKLAIDFGDWHASSRARCWTGRSSQSLFGSHISTSSLLSSDACVPMPVLCPWGCTSTRCCVPPYAAQRRITKAPVPSLSQ